MTGHFYSCHYNGHDRLFVARCEALVSRTVHGSSSTATPIVNRTTIEFVLNDDMTINTVSLSGNDVLGYSRNELLGQWFGRFLVQNDVEKFEAIRQAYCKSSSE